MGLLMAACGGGDGTASTTVGSTATSPTTTTVVTTTTVTLTDLTGTWENGELRLEVNEGGEYVLRAPGDPTDVLMGGFVARDEGQFSFVTATTGECPGQTGIYAATVDDDVLTMTLVDDPCELRASGFGLPFTRAG